MLRREGKDWRMLCGVESTVGGHSLDRVEQPGSKGKIVFVPHSLAYHVP